MIIHRLQVKTKLLQQELATSVKNKLQLMIVQLLQTELQRTIQKQKQTIIPIILLLMII